MDRKSRLKAASELALGKPQSRLDATLDSVSFFECPGDAMVNEYQPD
jgi:hypothetical protein